MSVSVKQPFNHGSHDCITPKSSCWCHFLIQIDIPQTVCHRSTHIILGCLFDWTVTSSGYTVLLGSCVIQVLKNQFGRVPLSETGTRFSIISQWAFRGPFSRHWVIISQFHQFWGTFESQCLNLLLSPSISKCPLNVILCFFLPPYSLFPHQEKTTCLTIVSIGSFEVRDLLIISVDTCNLLQNCVSLHMTQVYCRWHLRKSLNWVGRTLAHFSPKHKFL